MESHAEQEQRPTAEEVERRLVELCRANGMAGPDVVVDTDDGEFVAMWLASKVAVVVDATGEPV